MRVSVLGMGRMGAALAIRLATGGHEVTVWNRSPGKTGPALEAGASEAGSREEAVTGAEVVMTMLADDDAVRRVALGDEGVRALLGPDAVYMDSSTVSPGLSEELARNIERYLAVPVFGSPEALQAGQASLVLGGPADVADRVEAVTGAISERVARLDTAPKALAAKLVGNYLLLAGLAVLAEAFEIGRAGGLDDAQLKAVFGEGPLVAPGLRNRFDGVLARDTDGWFTMRLGGKDARLGVELADRQGVHLPVAEKVAELYRRAVEAGLEEADVVAVGRIYSENLF